MKEKLTKEQLDENYNELYIKYEQSLLIDVEVKGLKKILMSFKKSNFIKFFVRIWYRFSVNHPEIARFLVFFMSSNFVTIIQMILQICLSSILITTSLSNVNFQYLPVPGATNFVTNDQYYIFDFPAGDAGGLAFFLATYITIAIAQVINFFLQRNITFKSKSNPWIAAMWYLIAFIVITLVSSALLGLYKKPIFDFFGNSFSWLANIIVVIINCAISFWVFYPIFKVIFPTEKNREVK